MSTQAAVSQSRWTRVWPAIALVVLAATWGRDLPAWLAIIVAVGLTAAVLTAVHHAEVVALRVGEPFGSLILALAVTVIEVALIVALIVAGDEKSETLARDTVFSAVMIACNGIVGICLLVGAVRHRVVAFQTEGAAGAFAAITAVATLSLVLPTFTTSEPGPAFSSAQLAFAAIASLFLYGLFAFVQTVRHRGYFQPVMVDEASYDLVDDGPDVSKRDAWESLGLLLVCLVGVVGLAKTLSPSIESAVKNIGAPITVVGVAIAMLVLLPETLAAVRAARRNRMQTSMNLAYGSALASIGLTIPTIAIASIWLEGPLTLGLGPKELVLLALTVAISTLTVLQGRANVLQAGIHLSAFAAFIFLAFVP